jgi:cell shape-determining protein MreC
MNRFSFEASRDRHDRRRLWYASVLVLVLFAGDVLSGGGLRAFAQQTMASVWSVSARVRSGIFDSGYFRTRSSLSRENALLREQLASYTERAASATALRADNAALRGLLHLAEGEEGITAPIVSSVRSSPYGTFLVGAGKNDAVAPGALVVTEGGFVVGQVTDVRDSVSLVTELFAGGVRVDAAIGNALAPAEGRGGGNARLSLPRALPVAEGDAVTSPELGGRPIGIVGKVETDASSAEQTVFVHLPINLSALRYVYVVPAR